MGPACAIVRCKKNIKTGTDNIPPPAPVKPIRKPINRPSIGVRIRVVSMENIIHKNNI
jgi:hypothetical protein